MRYAIVLIDYHSKWAEINFVSSANTETVLNFMRQVFFREGLPETLVTDNGVQLL